MGLDSTAKRIRNSISKHSEIFTIPKKKGACKYDENIIIPAIVNNRTKYEIEITVFRKKIKDNKYNIYIKFQISKSDKIRLETILGDTNKHIIEKLEKYKENICYIDITIPSEDDIYENFIDILAAFYKDEEIIHDDDNILKIDEKKMNIENSQNIKSDNPFGYKYLEEYR